MTARSISWCAFAALAAAFIFMLAVCAGCVKCDPPTDLTGYEKPFGVVSAEAPSPPKSFNVFIDASRSMYGFTAPNSKFHDIINSVISRIPQDAKIQLYAFGRSSVELEGDLRKMMHTLSDRNFYSQTHTDLCKPFDEHIKSDPNSVNLIITDMVQSTEYAAQDRAIFARLLRQYLGEDGFLSLMATQADFQGDYYTEKAPSTIKVGDASTRPLYCLAFGNRKFSKFVQDKIGTLFEHSFEFGTTSENKLERADNSDRRDDPESFIFERNDEDLPVSEFILKKGHTDYLKVAMSGYEDRFGKTLDYAVAYKGKADSIYTELNGAGGMIQADSLGDDGRVSFKVPFNNNDPGEYIVRLTFRKTLPGWIHQLNTDDDTKAENLNKTYMLEPWMRFIMDNFEDYKHLATTQYYLYICRK